MTTTVVKTIGSASDYATIQLWEDAAPANLVTSDQVWQGQLQNQTFTPTAPAVTFSGSTVDATRYKHLTCVAGASFRDNASVRTNALRYNASNGAAIACGDNYNPTIQVNEQNVHLSGLQFANTNSSKNCLEINQPNCFVDFCIVEGALTPISCDGATIRNTLVIKRSTSGSSIVGVQGNSTLINCTIAVPSDITKSTNGISVGYPSGTTTVKNCVVLGATTAYSSAGTSTLTTNKCDQASPPAGFATVTYNTALVTATVDASRDFRVVSGSALIDGATTDTTNAPIDISGTARPVGASYDFGCWEYSVAAAGGGFLIGSKNMSGGMVQMSGGMRG